MPPETPSTPAGQGSSIPSYLAQGGGRCGEALRAMDWRGHVLGPMQDWPQELKSVLGTVLRAQQAIFIFWGEQLVCFYNDAYMPTFGATNQTLSLGRLGREMWQDIWADISPQVEATMQRAESSWHEDQLLPFFRNGQIESTYWTYGYAPIFLSDESVGGAFITCMETTKRVLSERRLQTSQDLSANVMGCRTPQDVLALLMTTLEAHHDDIVQVSFTREIAAEHLPMTLQSKRMLPTSGHTSAAPEFYQTQVMGNIANMPIGTLRFEVASRVVLDAALIDFCKQLTDRISIAIETMRTRMQGDIFFNLPHRLLCIASNAGYLTRVSPGFVDALGYDAAYLKSRPFTQFVHPDDLERTLGAIAKLLEEQTVINFNNRYRCRDGSYKWFSWVSQPHDGLVYCVVHDITELKSAEEELRKALNARDAFLSIASHELKTPITSLKLYSQLIERQYKKQGLGYFSVDRIERVIRMLLTQSDRLGRLVEDMLDISRIAAGRLAMQKEQNNLTDLVTDVLSRFDLQFKAVASTVRFVSTSDVHGRFDAFRIEQVLSNLLTNALRYAPGEAVTVSLQVDGTTAVLRVADTGPGISPAYRERIFQRFERFVSSSEVSGLGLGLYISQQIITAHEGSIRLDTTMTLGACFEVRLPLGHNLVRQKPAS